MSVPDLSIVIPVYNNETTLDELLDRLAAVLDGITRSYEIIPVDDGSTDGSLALLQRRALRDPRIRPVALSRNFGGQSAVCAGFDVVLGKRTICLDADLENLPEDIPRLLEALDGGADLVCGVREMRTVGFARRMPSAVMNAYARSRMRVTVQDIGCGMRAMDSRLVRNLASEGEKRRFLTPLLIQRAHKVVEVPIRHAPPPAPGAHTFFSLFAIAGDFFLVTAGRPFHVTGLACLVVGGVALLGTIGAVLTGRPALAIGCWLTAVGCGVGAIASLVGEYAQRIYEFSQGRPYYQVRDLPPLAETEKRDVAAPIVSGVAPPVALTGSGRSNPSQGPGDASGRYR